MTRTTLILARVSKNAAKRFIELANATGQSESRLAAQAIEEYLALQEWQIKAIHKGIAEADAGKLLPHEEAAKRLATFGKRPKLGNTR
ncbi:MAG: CopG family ribbon-helix-helix protein [Gammaproteobacteria bacterium]